MSISEPTPPAPPHPDRSLSGEVRRRYDRGAGRYDVLTWPMERLAMDRYRKRLLARVRGPRVLEVGVGTGRNLPLYDPSLEVDAIDFSPRMLARARLVRPQAAIRLALMDAEALMWPAATFDTVVSTCVFCSVPNPLRGLAEIRRVLRPDGRALFLEHVRPGGPWVGMLFDWLDPLVARAGPHINRRTVENIRLAGLSVLVEVNLVSDVVKIVVASPR
ncbi:MAG: class I SAM-dependent methyltransferase [Vicinamibacterales bacterium]